VQERREEKQEEKEKEEGRRGRVFIVWGGDFGYGCSYIKREDDVRDKG